MTETTRTVAYVVVAAVSGLIAWFATPSANLTPADFDKKVGQAFFPDFKSNDATSVRVITFDEAKAQSKVFAVEFKDGLWTIPSHHNYPADSKTQLSKTANPFVELKRDEFRSASKEDHEELGVVDPLDEDTTRLKGRGQRVTLSKGDTTLADLIIGKQVRDRPGYYYVRNPEENSTYVAKLDVTLSTKFSDWVETDLLKAKPDSLTHIEIDDYAIQAEGGGRAVIKPGTVTRLERAKAGDPWKLEGLNEQTEELDNTKISDLTSTLSGLKLSGVRPKPKGLRPDLTFDPEFIQDRLQAELLMVDMGQRGFLIGPDLKDKDQQRLYSRQGEMFAATNEGVVYTLRFGEIFSGDESEIEIGGNKQEDDPKEEKDEDEEGSDKKKDGKDTAGKQSSRYLFVSASFDESYLGPKPVEPERPAGFADEEGARKEDTEDGAPKIRPSRRRQKATDSKAEKDSKPQDETTESKKSEECGEEKAAEEEKASEPAKEEDAKPAEEARPADAAAEEKAEPADKDKGEAKPADKTPAEPAEKPKTPEELKREYDTLKQKYEADLKSYEDKVKAGQEKVEELNLRFGSWYYVISADSFNKLHLSRKDLVKEKKPADDKSKPADAAKTTEEASGAEETEKPGEETKPGEEAKPVEEPEADAEAPKAGEKPAKEDEKPSE